MISSNWRFHKACISRVCLQDGFWIRKMPVAPDAVAHNGWTRYPQACPQSDEKHTVFILGSCIFKVALFHCVRYYVFLHTAWYFEFLRLPGKMRRLPRRALSGCFKAADASLPGPRCDAVRRTASVILEKLLEYAKNIWYLRIIIKRY